MISGLSDVGRDLQVTLDSLLSDARRGDDLSVEQELEILSSLESRLKTALRARKATNDLHELLGVEQPARAVDLTRRWRPAAQKLSDSGVLFSRNPAFSTEKSFRFASYEEADDDQVYFTTGKSFIADAVIGELSGLWAAVRTLLTEAGYEVLVEGEERPGSIWKDWALKGSRKAAKNLVAGTATAVQDSYVRNPGAQATAELAQATVGLINAMGEREGVHAYDNLVIGQFRGPDGELRSFSKELSLQERRTLDANPALLQEPAMILARLHALLPPAIEAPSALDEEGPPELTS